MMEWRDINKIWCWINVWKSGGV